jgi:arginyl-tRNA--protein-N-Asp/Glu arginylyltransferase
MFNIKNNLSTEENYQNGLLPQRNLKDTFYQDDNYSSRCNLTNLQFSSENRRIFNKTANFTFKSLPLKDFQNYTPTLQKKLFDWSKKLEWGIPASTIKILFNDHIFNHLYVWSDDKGQESAYALCYFSPNFSHIAYVFYDPKYDHHDLPIRLSLQVIKDSYDQKLKYCYLGRFNPDTKLGYYKRNFPAFQYFIKGQWLPYNK